MKERRRDAPRRAAAAAAARCCRSVVAWPEEVQRPCLAKRRAADAAAPAILPPTEEENCADDDGTAFWLGWRRQQKQKQKVGSVAATMAAALPLAFPCQYALPHLCSPHLSSSSDCSQLQRQAPPLAPHEDRPVSVQQQRELCTSFSRGPRLVGGRGWWQLPELRDLCALSAPSVGSILIRANRIRAQCCTPHEQRKNDGLRKLACWLTPCAIYRAPLLVVLLRARLCVKITC
jgi:hypothetical protein